MPRKRLVQAAFGFGALLGLNAAQGLDFQFVDNGIPDEVRDQVLGAFQKAADRWSANISSDLTVTVNVDFRPFENSNVLGSTSLARNVFSYDSVQRKLNSRASSPDDQAAVANLPSDPWMLFNRTSGLNGSATPDIYPVSSVALSEANARVLGLNAQFFSNATVEFNRSVLWDFDPLDGIAANHIDLIGVATHELGHVLGFGSVVDNLDNLAPGTYDESGIYPTVLDLFRFSALSLQNKVSGVASIDVTTGATGKYFSLDNGATSIAAFATGVNFGDGNQASHWKDGLGLGIMDPTAGFGEQLKVSQLDRRMFDVLGYTLNTQWTWAGASDDVWSNAMNWPTASMPDAAIAVTFAKAGSYGIRLIAQPAQTANMTVTGGGSLTLNTGTTTLTVGSALRIGSTSVDTATLTILGAGSVTAASVDVRPGSVLNLNAGTLSATNVSNSGTFAQSGGTLNIAGRFTNSGGNTTLSGVHRWGVGAELVTSGGTVQLNTDAGAGGANLQLTANAGGTVNFGSNQHIKSITLNGGSAVMIGARQILMTGDLAMDSLGQLDMGTSNLVIRSPQTTTFAQVSNWVKLARDSRWGTAGITTSAARQNPSLTTTLVPTLNDRGDGSRFLTSLAGESLLASDIIVRYTYIGDVNLDGVVNGTDFIVMTQGYSNLQQGNLGHPVAFTDGDVNFDNVINGTDFILATQGYSAAQQYGALSMVSPLNAVVPEPGTVGLLSLGVAGLLSSRRGRRL